jgi:hypothetical protein
MKLDPSFGSAFHRAAAFFPSAGVVVETGLGTIRPDSFCPVSFDPAIVALTFAECTTGLPGQEFSVAALAFNIEDAAPVRLDCTLLETKEVGDHVMCFATVRRVEIRGGRPLVNWRRASFKLRLDYPFLESNDALETFVNSWRTGVLAKNAWTHAAHVAVTGYYAFDYAPESVFSEIKSGILHFNSCTGVVNGPDSGYHETLTQFWSNTITRAVRNGSPKSRLDAANFAVQLFGEDRDLPTLFYSFDVVRDRRARGEWMIPDREPLPEWWAIGTK